MASVEALAVQSSGNIVAVGSSAEVLLLQQPATQVKDLQGAFVMPASLSSTSHYYTACYCRATPHAILIHIHSVLRMCVLYTTSYTLAFGL